MQYEVQTIPFEKIPLSSDGALEPLCNTCTNPDCSNPIKERVVSIVGKQVKYRLYVISSITLMVVGCKDGYVGDEDASLAMGSERL